MEANGYFEESDDQGITRAGTDRLYLLDFHGTQLEKINEEFGDVNYSGLYLLINSTKNEIYIGESSNVKIRNEAEIKKPPVPDFEFGKIILIWDGRPTTTSHFGVDAFRKSLEKICIRVFDDYSKYKCVNTVKNPKITNVQISSSVTRFTNDLYFLLKKYNLIHTIPE